MKPLYEGTFKYNNEVHIVSIRIPNFYGEKQEEIALRNLTITLSHNISL